MVRELRWDEWAALEDDARLERAREIIASLAQRGPVLGEPRLETFGPPDEECRVAIVEDLRAQAWLALVPGGTFQPGLDDEGLRRFWELERAWLEVAGSLGREHELPYTCTEWSPSQLGRRPSVDIDAMLIAIQPLSASALGLPSPRFSARPLLSFEDALAAAARLGYDIPASEELEWATRGGDASLFHWGDALPDAVDPRAEPPDVESWEEAQEEFAATYMSLAEGPVAPWPQSNCFGLQGAAGQPVWCQGMAGEGLVTGGADRFFPWQACGEWLWLIPSLRVEAATIHLHQGAMLRPIVRLR